MRCAAVLLVVSACATPPELEREGTREQALVGWNTTLSPGNGADNLDAPSLAEAGGRLYAVGFPPHTEVRYAVPASGGSLPSWTATTSLPVSINNAGLVAYNGWLYVLWGGVETAPDTWSENLNVYRAPIQADGTLGSWTSSGGLQSVGFPPRATAFVANGYLYAVSYDEKIQYAKIQSDGSLGGWTLDNSVTDAGTYRGVAAYGGYVYTFGGWYSLAASNIYQDLIRVAALNSNGSVGTWTTLTTHLPDARSAMGAALVGSTLYLVGGQKSGASETTTVLRVELAANGGVTSIVADASLPAPLYGANAAATANYLYVQGGWHQQPTAGSNLNSYVATLSSSAVDAGLSVDDGGADGDGGDGNGGSDESGDGCGCHSASGAGLLWTLVMWVLLRRRTRRSR